MPFSPNGREANRLDVQRTACRMLTVQIHLDFRIHDAITKRKGTDKGVPPFCCMSGHVCLRALHMDSTHYQNLKLPLLVVLVEQNAITWSFA